MGRDLLKAVVPFKLEGVYVGDAFLTGEFPEGSLREYLEAMEDDLTPGRKTVRGWGFDPSEAHEHGQGRNCLYVHKLTKGRFAVYAINEHEYSDGGGLIQSFFADDKGSLEEFCKDWEFDPAEITENAATVQVV